jgi:hypothetical protein
MIGITHSGSFRKTEAFLKSMLEPSIPIELETYARRGVDALRAATPSKTGETANAWYYEITRKSHRSWSIAVILQYGHGTGTGGYVQGRDYINPALRSIFDDLSDTAWKVVTSA